MSSLYEVAREALATVIESHRAEFVIPTFDLHSTPLPKRFTNEQIIANPQVHCITLGYDEDIATRTNRGMIELTTQVILQAAVAVDDDGEFDHELVDQYLQMRSQLAVAAKKVTFDTTGPGRGFKWMRNLDPRDAQGLPYAYELFKDEQLFQAYVNSVYMGAVL